MPGDVDRLVGLVTSTEPSATVVARLLDRRVDPADLEAVVARSRSLVVGVVRRALFTLAAATVSCRKGQLKYAGEQIAEVWEPLEQAGLAHPAVQCLFDHVLRRLNVSSRIAVLDAIYSAVPHQDTLARALLTFQLGSSMLQRSKTNSQVLHRAYELLRESHTILANNSHSADTRDNARVLAAVTIDLSRASRFLAETDGRLDPAELLAKAEKALSDTIYAAPEPLTAVKLLIEQSILARKRARLGIQPWRDADGDACELLKEAERVLAQLTWPEGPPPGQHYEYWAGASERLAELRNGDAVRSHTARVLESLADVEDHLGNERLPGWLLTYAWKLTGDPRLQIARARIERDINPLFSIARLEWTLYEHQPGHGLDAERWATGARLAADLLRQRGSLYPFPGRQVPGIASRYWELRARSSDAAARSEVELTNQATEPERPTAEHIVQQSENSLEDEVGRIELEEVAGDEADQSAEVEVRSWWTVWADRVVAHTRAKNPVGLIAQLKKGGRRGILRPFTEDDANDVAAAILAATDSYPQYVPADTWDEAILNGRPFGWLLSFAAELAETYQKGTGADLHILAAWAARDPDGSFNEWGRQHLQQAVTLASGLRDDHAAIARAALCLAFAHLPQGRPAEPDEKQRAYGAAKLAAEHQRRVLEASPSLPDLADAGQGAQSPVAHLVLVFLKVEQAEDAVCACELAHGLAAAAFEAVDSQGLDRSHAVDLLHEIEVYDRLQQGHEALVSAAEQEDLDQAVLERYGRRLAARGLPGADINSKKQVQRYYGKTLLSLPDMSGLQDVRALTEVIGEGSSGGVAVAHLLHTNNEDVLVVGVRPDGRAVGRSLDLGVELLTQLTKDIRQDWRSPTMPSLEHIDRLVAEPLLDLLDEAATLVVVPHGLFCALPVHAALAERRPRTRVIYTHSVSALARRMKRSRQSTPQALVIGHDVTLEADAEAFNVGTVLAQHGLSVVAPVDAAESVARLQEAERWGVLHVAGHGNTRPHPWALESELELDGHKVTAASLLRGGVRAELACLNVCKAMGDEGHGGDLRGFPFSLAASGTPTSVLTMAPVQSAAAHLFARVFYDKLVAGASALDSFHSAITSLRSDSTFSAPQAWAPYVFLGDPRSLFTRT